MLMKVFSPKLQVVGITYGDGVRTPEVRNPNAGSNSRSISIGGIGSRNLSMATV
jgi:hypothetical protein